MVGRSVKNFPLILQYALIRESVRFALEWTLVVLHAVLRLSCARATKLSIHPAKAILFIPRTEVQVHVLLHELYPGPRAMVGASVHQRSELALDDYLMALQKMGLDEVTDVQTDELNFILQTNQLPISSFVVTSGACQVSGNCLPDSPILEDGGTPYCGASQTSPPSTMVDDLQNSPVAVYNLTSDCLWPGDLKADTSNSTKLIVDSPPSQRFELLTNLDDKATLPTDLSSPTNMREQSQFEYLSYDSASSPVNPPSSLEDSSSVPEVAEAVRWSGEPEAKVPQLSESRQMSISDCENDEYPKRVLQCRIQRPCPSIYLRAESECERISTKRDVLCRPSPQWSYSARANLEPSEVRSTKGRSSASFCSSFNSHKYEDGSNIYTSPIFKHRAQYQRTNGESSLADTDASYGYSSDSELECRFKSDFRATTSNYEQDTIQSDKGHHWPRRRRRNSASHSEMLDGYSDLSYCSHLSDLPDRNERQLRDVEILDAVSLPFAYDEVAYCPNDRFRELKATPGLSEAQITAMLDARRRATNRQAAERCRRLKTAARDGLAYKLEQLRLSRAAILKRLGRARQHRQHARDDLLHEQDALLKLLFGPDGNRLHPSQWRLQTTGHGELVVVEVSNSG